MIVCQIFGTDNPDDPQGEFDLGRSGLEWANYLGSRVQGRVKAAADIEVKVEVFEHGPHHTLRFTSDNPMWVRIVVNLLQAEMRAQPSSWLGSHRPNRPQGLRRLPLYL